MKIKNDFGSFLLKYLKGQNKIILLVGVFFIVNIALQIIAPQVLSHFIDSAKLGKPIQYVTLIILIYFGTVVINMIVSACESYTSQRFGWKITNEFRKDVLEHFLKIDMKQHEKWTSGEMITRLDEDVEGLFEYYYMLIFKLVGSVFLMIGVLIVLGHKNLLLALSMLGFCILGVWLFKTIQDYGINLYVQRAAAASKFSGIMKEKIDNVVEIRTNGAVKYSIHNLNVAMKKAFKESFPAGMMYAKLWSASTILDAMGTSLFLGFSVVLWDKGLISLGTVYLIYTYSELIYGPLQNFRDYLKTLNEAKARLMRVKEMLDIKSEIIEGTSEIDSKNITITIKNLSFGYSENIDVIDNVSFELKPGERLGVMGETGSGKTTLAKLIARLYDFDRGEILLNGISVKELTSENLSEHIAYCTQDVQMLHGTLRDNITLYNEDFSDDEIKFSIKQMGLEQWFQKFPEGLDTYFDMAENNLSAGEAQLLSIVRLFIRNPAIVILDEISSHLDTITEQRILSALDVLTKNRTVISITHKYLALRWVDKVMILNNGKIIERGRRVQLEKDQSSRFFSICKSLLQEKEVRINEI